MIIDHRTYTIQHGKSKEYIALFEKDGLPVQMKHLGRLVGYFETTIGPLNQVVHLWAYDSLADMEARRAARDADPAWANTRRNPPACCSPRRTRSSRRRRSRRSNRPSRNRSPAP